MNIVWRLEYDFCEDKTYKSPCCEECSDKHSEAVPVWLREDGLCECVNCHQTAEPDEKQRQWLLERQGTKVTTEKCFTCGKDTMETHYYKNKVTKEWQTAWGTCTNCGSRFIV